MKLSYEIADYLTSQGKRCIIRKEALEGQMAHSQLVTEEVEGILVLGGDGTLLRAARELADRKIPFLGINLGHLGYLAEIERQNVQNALEKLIQDEYTVEERMMLLGSVYVDGSIAEKDVALNDIVINRFGNLRVVNYEIYVNGMYLNSFTADGLIVSTPTGSTGYSLSAGGPIVSPTASMLVLTPICPHDLNGRSIVLSAQDVVEIEVLGNDDAGQVAVFDGDEAVYMKVGDRIRIARSETETILVKLKNISFLDNLRSKLAGI